MLYEVITLTQKPVLVLLNVGEGDLVAAPALIERIAAGYPHRHALVDALSAKIEVTSASVPGRL